MIINDNAQYSPEREGHQATTLRDGLDDFTRRIRRSSMPTFRVSNGEFSSFETGFSSFKQRVFEFQKPSFRVSMPSFKKSSHEECDDFSTLLNLLKLNVNRILEWQTYSYFDC